MKKPLLLTFTITLILIGCKNQKSDALVLNTAQGQAFGTTYQIKFFADEQLDLSAGLDSIFDRVNQSVSTYLPESDISKINRGDSTVVVDDIFKEVYLLSEEVYKQSKGYFDPTIGVLRNAYGFGDTKPLKSMDSTTLDSLMQFVGFSKVQLTQEGLIVKRNPNIYFDFNAVAKGYGIDQLAAYLDSRGIKHYLIELGGELIAKGKQLQKDSPWVVGVEAVDSQLEERSFEATVKLMDAAMASSGNYRKFRVDPKSGKRFVHTLNPLTGSAQESDLTSATVIANTCAKADAYATAFMAMGLERSKEMLSNLSGIEVYFTYIENDATRTYVSPGFKALFAN